MSGMEWAILGEVFVVLFVFDSAYHFYYVFKNVWLFRRALGKPTLTLPSPGIATINGIVSSIGDECPVQVALTEDVTARRGSYFWQQTGQSVDAHPFALLLPETGVRILVEPGNEIDLRASARVSDWEVNDEVRTLRRIRTATLNDGDRAIITGVLSEKREIEKVAGEYRSQKEKVYIEYVLRPIPDKGLRIDSQTLLDEIRTATGYRGWVRLIGTPILIYVSIYAIRSRFHNWSIFCLLASLVGYFFPRFTFDFRDHRPWFDRKFSYRKPYYAAEDSRQSKVRDKSANG